MCLCAQMPASTLVCVNLCMAKDFVEELKAYIIIVFVLGICGLERNKTYNFRSHDIQHFLYLVLLYDNISFNMSVSHMHDYICIYVMCMDIYNYVNRR